MLCFELLDLPINVVHLIHLAENNVFSKILLENRLARSHCYTLLRNTCLVAHWLHNNKNQKLASKFSYNRTTLSLGSCLWKYNCHLSAWMRTQSSLAPISRIRQAILENNKAFNIFTTSTCDHDLREFSKMFGSTCSFRATKHIDNIHHERLFTVLCVDMIIFVFSKNKPYTHYNMKKDSTKFRRTRMVDLIRQA